MRNQERPYRDLPEVRAADYLITRLTTLRIRRGISQRGLAKRMNTTQSTVCDFERRIVDPRMSTFQRYAKAIGCRIVARLTDLREEGAEESLPVTALMRSHRPISVPIDHSHVRPVRQDSAYASGPPWQIPSIEELTAYAHKVSPVDVRRPFIRPIREHVAPDSFLAGVRS